MGVVNVKGSERWRRRLEAAARFSCASRIFPPRENYMVGVFVCIIMYIN